METKSVKPRQTAENNPAYKIYLRKEVQCIGHENKPCKLSHEYIYIHTHTHIHTYIHTYTQSDNKPNRVILLFPQNGYNVRIKAMHFLKAPPFCDTLISLLKRIFKSKLAARVSVLNRMHILFLLTFAISIPIPSSH